jgi:hypothetical protein
MYCKRICFVAIAAVALAVVSSLGAARAQELEVYELGLFFDVVDPDSPPSFLKSDCHGLIVKSADPTSSSTVSLSSTGFGEYSNTAWYEGGLSARHVVDGGPPIAAVEVREQDHQVLFPIPKGMWLPIGSSAPHHKIVEQHAWPTRSYCSTRSWTVAPTE